MASNGVGQPASRKRHHAVQFYATEGFLCDTVADFLAEGLRSRQSALVIARPDRRDPLLAGVMARDGASLQPDDLDRLTFWDARDALSTFMAGDVPDAQRFRSSVGDMIERCVARGPGGSSPVARAYGEMVDVLWRDGLEDAAIRVEELWNELAERYPFDLLCAYAIGNFYGEGHHEQFDRVCRAHSHVRPFEAPVAVPDESVLDAQVARLHERAQVLEAEIAHRRQLEDALRRALSGRREAERAERRAREEAERASRAKSEFLAVMSHELRTPLNAIIGYQDLLERGVVGSLNPEQAAYIARIGISAHQLIMLIDQILSLSRIETGTDHVAAELFDAVELAHNAIEMVRPAASRKGLALQLITIEDTLPWCGDRDKVRQILLNLLSNAIKFTPAGGVSLEVKRDGDMLACAVHDTGIGIRPEDLSRIFDRFVQLDSTLRREQPGSGLGLAVSRHLARLIDGEISVDSTPGEGSCFTVRLPLATPSDTASEPSAARG